MIDIIQGFRPGSPDPIDSRLVLSKLEMRNINDDVMPDQYFAACKDDGLLYSYNKLNTPNSVSGKFVSINDFVYDVKVNNSSVISREDGKKVASVDLTNYALSQDVGHTIELSWADSQAKTYILKAVLKNNNGEDISSSLIDFPIESLISNITYDVDTKSIKFVLESGAEKTVSLTNLATELFVESKLNEHTSLVNNPHNVTKAQVGLSDVDNTSDLNKPISTATQQALNLKVSKVENSSLIENSEKERLTNIISGATKVSKSSTNGNVVVQVRSNGSNLSATELNVYTHPNYDAASVNPVRVGRDATGHVIIGEALNKADFGLSLVDNTSDLNKPISNAVSEALSNKVDKITGYQLSKNDFTDAYKNKLDSVASGAEVNVQSDWAQTATTEDDYIKNKPTKLSQFINDGDGTADSVYATQAYARQFDGKIDTLKVNGTVQPIDEYKAVDISMPTKLSDLVNDKGYISKAALTSDIVTEVSIGNIQAGKTLRKGTSIETILKLMFTAYVPPVEGIYVGSVSNLSKSNFKLLTSEELLNASSSRSTEELPFSWSPSTVKEIFFIMLKDGLSFGAGNVATLSSGGLITSFTANDIMTGGSWQNSSLGTGHNDVIIDGDTYHIYSYYSGSWNVGSDEISIINIKGEN